MSCRCNSSMTCCHCKPPRSNELIPTGGAQLTGLDHPSSGDGRRMRTRGGSRRAAARDPFGDLPAELLSTIMSNLDVKQAARTSVLSSAWRHAWKHCPKLALDIVAICGDGYRSCKPGDGEEQYVRRFIDSVDMILRQRCGGGVVEQLELNFDESHLPQVSSHLDEWIRFAVSSQAKSLKLHVSARPPVLNRRDLYGLPLQLLDAGGCVSNLQYIDLSNVTLKLPPHTESIGFPNLKSLRLRLAPVSASDLQDMLPNCPNLERLDLSMVNLDDDKLRVHRPLPRLLYLRLVDCRVTEIQLIANQLTTFIFRGILVPTIINLGETPGLRNVSIQCFKLTLQQAVSSLPTAFRMVRRLSLHCTCILPTVLSSLEKTSRFPHLRYLHLPFCIYPEHPDTALSIAYFLESAPLLEELDIKFVPAFKNGGQGPPRRIAQGRSEYKHLKSLRAREFTGQKDQLELITHIIENAPALGILTIDPIREHVPATEAETTRPSDIHRRATTVISKKLLVKTKFVVL